MSMTGRLRAVAPGVLDGLDEAAVLDLLLDEDALDLGKAWHGLHFLLTGTAWEGDGPLAAAILGGEEITGDLGYGAARCLSPRGVAEVALALGASDVAAVIAGFDARAM